LRVTLGRGRFLLSAAAAAINDRRTKPITAMVCIANELKIRPNNMVMYILKNNIYHRDGERRSEYTTTTRESRLVIMNMGMT